jgi:cytochrome c oxidase assembly protein subunit 15
LAEAEDNRAGNQDVSRSVRVGAYLLVGLIIGQIALGGLVAGSRAGLTYNTWPLMDGAFVPGGATLFAGTPFIENFVDNPALVQFNHRMAALLLVAIAVWHAYAAWRAGPPSTVRRGAGLLAGLTVAQAALGVVTLLLVVPLWAGLAHQLAAIGLLAFATFHARRCASLRPVAA